MSHLLAKIIFQAGVFVVMGSNDPSLSVDRVKVGHIVVHSRHTIGKCRVTPMDGHLEPAFSMIQGKDQRHLHLFLMGLRRIDLNFYLECERS